MKASERATGPRIESRYLGAAPYRAGSGREEGADAVLVLAELRAKLDALLERDPVTPARRDILENLSDAIGAATARIAGGNSPPVEESRVVPPEPRWMSRLGSELETMQAAEDAAELMAHVARTAHREVGADACVITFLDSARGVLREVAAASADNRRLHVVAQEYPLDRYSARRAVVSSGRAAEVAATDPDGDPAEKSLLEELGFRRALVCPLLVSGETLGTIAVYRKLDNPFEGSAWPRLSKLLQFVSGPYSRISLTERLRDHYTKTLEVLTSALEVRDVRTHQHTSRIRERAMALADAMRIPPEDKTSVRLGAMLHDVGKLGVPDAILLKPGPLTEEEWAMMRRHPEIGEGMLSSLDFVAPALPVVRHHHERWDGRGYPDGLAGDEIPVAARIVAVCDAFDAMTSDRPYRRATTAEAACEELVACAGTQFDPLCVSVLVNLVQDAEGRDLDEHSIVRYAS